MATFSSVSKYVTATLVTVGCAFASLFIYRRIKTALSARAIDVFKLDINVVSKSEECKPLINEIRRRSMAQGHNAIGYDCEWVTRGGRRKPVALLQLSTFDGYCVLIRLNLMDEIPTSLRQLLEDEDIYKVGVAPLNDANYLYHDHGVTTMSTIDLRHLAEMCGYNAGGLAHLTETLLHVKLDKRFKIRCGNWDADTLSPEQLHYAASDAHAAIQIFVKLIDELDKYEHRTAWCVSDTGDSVWSSLDAVCAKYTDYNYKKIHGQNNEGSKKQSGRGIKPYPHAARSRPLYDNCLLQAPDGDLLCTCDRKKALWYIEKGLADQIASDPLIVRLKFEPAGRSVGQVGKYYQTVKENRCVVCGETNSYIRKNVVPREYRKFFPEIMKDRSSHDVLLLCARCHQRSNVRERALRARLAVTAHAPPRHVTAAGDDTCRKVRNAARALLMHGNKHNLPAERQKELRAVVLEYYTDYTEVTEQLLREACKVSDMVVKPQDNMDSHGRAVVNYYREKPAGLLQLEEIWREHFLTTMRPKHMPALWSVKHTEERLRIKYKEGRLTEEDLHLIGIKGW